MTNKNENVKQNELMIEFEEVTSNSRGSRIEISNWKAIADVLKQALQKTKTGKIAVPVKSFNSLVGKYANETPTREKNAGYWQSQWANNLRENLKSVGILATDGTRRENKLFFRRLQ